MTQPVSRYLDGLEDEEPRVRVSFFPEWMVEAICAGMDETLFFGASDPDQRPQYTLTEIKKARKLCAQCPVARICLESSLRNNDEYGVFAGSTRTNRVGMRKRIDSGSTTVEDEVVTFISWLKESFLE